MKEHKKREGVDKNKIDIVYDENYFKRQRLQQERIEKKKKKEEEKKKKEGKYLDPDAYIN